MNPTLKVLEALRSRIREREGINYQQVGDHGSNELKSTPEDIKRDLKIRIRTYDKANFTLDEPWDYGEM